MAKNTWKSGGRSDPYSPITCDGSMSSLRNTVILSLRRIYVSMSRVDILAPKLIVAKEVEGHERLNVLDPSALVIQ